MEASSQSLLDDLYAQENINLARAAWLEQPAEPLAAETDFDRIRGMLLGLAIGDSLGAVSEGLTPARRRDRFGLIEDYPANPWAGGRAVGTPTDDSQLAFYTLEHLLKGDQLDPRELGMKFVREPIFGIGGTVSRALQNLEAGVAWYQAGPRSAGNGALMRIAPILVPHIGRGGLGVWAETAISAMLTHNDPASTAACLAYIAMLWELLSMEEPPKANWWVERYFQLADPLENAYDYQPRLASAPAHKGRICDFVAEHVPPALEQGDGAREACDRWGSGAYLLETLPSVFFILSRHASNPERAIVSAVNDTLDNDTHGAIVGAAVGALHGAEALPERWRAGLTGQLRGGDDGAIQSLIDQAEANWWPSG